MNFLLHSYVCMYAYIVWLFLNSIQINKKYISFVKNKLYALDFVLIILFYTSDKKYNVWIIIFALINS